LERRGISYLEKGRGLFGPAFQGRKGRGTDHGLTVAITKARGGHHGLAVAGSPCLARLGFWAVDTTGCPW